jgi:DNA-binding GntR family transcriptional regulator
MVNVPVQRSLGTLANQGVIEVEDGRVALVPELLHATVEHLRGRQLIW